MECKAVFKDGFWRWSAPGRTFSDPNPPKKRKLYRTFRILDESPTPGIGFSSFSVELKTEGKVTPFSGYEIRFDDIELRIDAHNVTEHLGITTIRGKARLRTNDPQEYFPRELENKYWKFAHERD